jgi:hypothetical protein
MGKTEIVSSWGFSMENDFAFRVMRLKIWEMASQLGSTIEGYWDSARKCLLCGDNRRAKGC